MSSISVNGFSYTGTRSFRGLKKYIRDGGNLVGKEVTRGCDSIFSATTR